MSKLFTTLQERGFLNDCTDEKEFIAQTEKSSQSFYCGFDPTADSLTIGNMVCLMALRHIQLCGHRPVVLMGGATGMIGDPSGKSKERNLQTTDQIQLNLAGQKKQFSLVLDFDGDNAAKIVNNYDWFAPITFIEFLRDVGKHFRVGDMLGKDSVRSRIQSEAGISYTEFSYTLLQAYDFLHLFREENCRFQCGGSDQWGNIVSGTELIRRSLGESAIGITFPLITTSSGQKLGKTAEGAVWMDREKTSPYEFYQYWVRTDDRDVERYLKLFTFLPMDQIQAAMEEHAKAPESRSAQKLLADQVTSMIHGKAESQKAIDAASALFADSLSDLTDEKMVELFPDVPSISFPVASLDGEGASILELLTNSGLASSNKQGRELLKQGGIYLNNEPLAGEKRTLTKDDLASPTMAILRAGKKRYCLVKFE